MRYGKQGSLFRKFKFPLLVSQQVLGVVETTEIVVETEPEFKPQSNKSYQ